MKRKVKLPIGQPVLRSQAARSAWDRNGGTHGGSSRANNRRDRQSTRQSLRQEYR